MAKLVYNLPNGKTAAWTTQDEAKYRSKFKTLSNVSGRPVANPLAKKLKSNSIIGGRG